MSQKDYELGRVWERFATQQGVHTDGFNHRGTLGQDSEQVENALWKSGAGRKTLGVFLVSFGNLLA